MASQNKEYVLEKMREVGLRAATQLQSEISSLTETEVIDREFDAPDFNPDKQQFLDWELGSVVRSEDQVWNLVQKYDSSIFKDPPSQMRAQWGLLHTKNPYKAKPFVPAHGTSGMYMKDECILEDTGKVFKSTIDNNEWKPADYPQGWEEVVLETEEETITEDVLI